MDLDPRALFSSATKLAERFGDEAYFAALCVRSGMIGLPLPHRSAQMLRALERHGLVGGAISAGAVRFGSRPAIIDELGAVSYKQLDRRSNAIANCWREHGLVPGEGVAILARNHRGFLDAVFAAAKCGARVILLNTSFAGPQIREVAEREGTDLLVYDEEYGRTLEGIEPPRGRWRAWAEEPGEDTLGALIARGSAAAPPKAGMTPRITILTSGTTGSPKGAPRAEPRSLSLLGSLLSKVPFRARETTELSVPMFHALGFAQALVGIGLGSTLVVHRRFDPEQTLDSLERHRASAMVAVPVMLQRMLELDGDAIAQRDLSELRIIFVSGSALGAELAPPRHRGVRAGDLQPVRLDRGRLRDDRHARGSPRLRPAPSARSSAARWSRSSTTGGRRACRAVRPGRIFVGNLTQFEGYTGGGSKEQVRGLMASGDVGHFDEHDRLFVEGRDDEMIVSGGENVFPAEVEELLARHEAIAEAAVIGVDDERFGQGLKAFVVTRPAATLTEDEVKDYVGDNLARYKTPRQVVFIDSLPA